jgi:hypothetical protein
MYLAEIVNCVSALAAAIGAEAPVAPRAPSDAMQTASATVAVPIPVSLDSHAEHAPAPHSADDVAWKFDAFVYYWSAGVSGDLTLDGQDVDLDDGGDGFSGDSALTGFLGHFEAHHGPWSFALAPMFVNLDLTGTESGGVDAEVELRVQVHEAFVAHDLGANWNWLAGARYYDLDTTADLSIGGVPAGSVSSQRSWVDPIVGLRFHDDLDEHWSVRARADIGGFGVGSDFAWSASAFAGYRFNSCTGAWLGYRALSVDFSRGSGSSELTYDLTMAGPILGVSFSF